MPDDEDLPTVTNRELDRVPPRHWRLARFLVEHIDGQYLRLTNLVRRIEQTQERIMTNQAHIDAVVETLTTETDEIQAAIAELKARPEAEALDFSRLDAAVGRVADVIPDVAPPA